RDFPYRQGSRVHCVASRWPAPAARLSAMRHICTAQPGATCFPIARPVHGQTSEYLTMTNSPRQGTATLAVLIDADNAAPAIVEGLLAEVAKYGVAAVKRIYGAWTRHTL